MPFRFKTAPNRFPVLHIEELENVPEKATIELKNAWDVCRERNWRVVVLATSNSMAGLEDALRHRFGDPYEFSSDISFAVAFSNWTKTVWAMEGGGELPEDWQAWGFDERTGKYSGRLALDRMESRLLSRKGVAV